MDPERRDPSTHPARRRLSLEWRDATVAALVLGGLALAASLCVLEVANHDLLVDLVLRNELPIQVRRAWVATSGAVGAGVAALALLFAGSAAVRRALPNLARIALPLLVTPLLPVLLVRKAWRDELELLVVIAVVGFALERTLATSFAALPQPPVWLRLGTLPRWGRRLLPPLLVAAAVAWYFLLIGHYTVICHHRMLTATADLGEFENLFFNALSGNPYRAPAIGGEATENWSALKIHSEFMLYAVLPVYALRPRAETLLYLQSGVIALTAVPVYLMAARRLGRGYGVLLALVVLLLPIVQRPNFYDFHFTPVGMLCVMWTLYLLDGVSPVPRRGEWRRLSALGLAFTCGLLSREDVAAGLSLLALAYTFVRSRPWVGVALAIPGFTYVVVLRWALTQAFGPSMFVGLYAGLKAAGASGFGAVALTLATNPAFVLQSLLTLPKLTYALHLLAPLNFLWVRRVWLLAAALPAAGFTLLVTDRPFLYMSSFQYTYLWVPYLMGATILALDTIGQSRGRAARAAAAGALCVTVSLASFHQGALLGAKEIVGGFGPKRFVMTEADHRRLADLRALAALIPPEASVAATEFVGPHVSNRVDLWERMELRARPDYMFMGPPAPLERDRAAEVIRAGEYGLIAERGDFMLLKKGADTKENAQALRRLGLP